MALGVAHPVISRSTRVPSPSMPLAPLDMLCDTAQDCWGQRSDIPAVADGAKVRLRLHPEPGSTQGCWCQTCGTTEHACVSGAHPPDPLPSPHLCFSGWKGQEGWGGSGLPSPMSTGPLGVSLTFRRGREGGSVHSGEGPQPGWWVLLRPPPPHKEGKNHPEPSGRSVRFTGAWPGVPVSSATAPWEPPGHSPLGRRERRL